MNCQWKDCNEEATHRISWRNENVLARPVIRKLVCTKHNKQWAKGAVVDNGESSR